MKEIERSLAGLKVAGGLKEQVEKVEKDLKKWDDKLESGKTVSITETEL